MKTSWRLLADFLFFWRYTPNPIFWRHAVYDIESPVGTVWSERLQGCAVLIAGTLCCLLTVGNERPVLLRVFLAGLWMFWTLLLGMILGPVVAEERERRTWELLLATPHTTATIINLKVRAAFWRERTLIVPSILLTLGMALAIGFGLRYRMPFAFTGNPRLANPTNACGSTVAAASIVGAIFLVDRGQHFVLVVVAALTASARATSLQGAVATGAIATLSVWITEIGIVALILICAAPPDALTLADGDLMLLALGPTTNFIRTLPLGIAFGASAGAVVVREMAIRKMWTAMLRAAHNATA